MQECAGTKGVEALREELGFFQSMRAQLLMAHEGKFVLIKGHELVGVFESQQQAYALGLEKLGNVPFLIKQVVREEPVQTIPALHFGLIRAHS